MFFDGSLILLIKKESFVEFFILLSTVTLFLLVFLNVFDEQILYLFKKPIVFLDTRYAIVICWRQAFDKKGRNFLVFNLSGANNADLIFT